MGAHAVISVRPPARAREQTCYSTWVMARRSPSRGTAASAPPCRARACSAATPRRRPRPSPRASAPAAARFSATSGPARSARGSKPGERPWRRRAARRAARGGARARTRLRRRGLAARAAGGAASAQLERVGRWLGTRGTRERALAAEAYGGPHLGRIASARRGRRAQRLRCGGRRGGGQAGSG